MLTWTVGRPSPGRGSGAYRLEYAVGDDLVDCDVHGRVGAPEAVNSRGAEPPSTATGPTHPSGGLADEAADLVDCDLDLHGGRAASGVLVNESSSSALLVRMTADVVERELVGGPRATLHPVGDAAVPPVCPYDASSGYRGRVRNAGRGWWRPGRPAARRSEPWAPSCPARICIGRSRWGRRVVDLRCILVAGGARVRSVGRLRVGDGHHQPTEHERDQCDRDVEVARSGTKRRQPVVAGNCAIGTPWVRAWPSRVAAGGG